MNSARIFSARGSRRLALSVVTIISALALVLLGATPAQAATSAATVGLSVTNQATPPVVVSSVPSGAALTYQVSLQCSGTVPCSDVTVDLSGSTVVAGTESYVSWTPPSGVTANLTPTPTGVHIAFTGTLAVGFSQTFPVNFSTANWTTSNGTVAPMTASVQGSNFTAPTPATKSVTLTATDMTYSLSKTTVSNQPAYAGGPDYSYKITIVGDPALRTACGMDDAAPEGHIRLVSFTLTDPLPAGAEFVGASTYAYSSSGPGATYDAGSRTVTSNWTGALTALCGDIVGGGFPSGMEVTVKWPEAFLPSGSDPITVTNTAHLSGLYANNDVLNLDTSVTHDLDPFTPIAAGAFTKRLSGFNDGNVYNVPATPEFQLLYGNDASSTVATTSVLISDLALPKETTGISLPAGSTANILTWHATDGSSGSVSNIVTFTPSAVLPAGSTLSGFTFEDDTPLASGGQRVILIDTAPSTDAEIGAHINCADATLSYPEGLADVNVTNSCAHYSVAAGLPAVWTGDLITHATTNGNVVAGQSVAFSASVKGFGAFSLHPQETLCVPAGWTIDAGSIVAANAASDGFSIIGTVTAGARTCTTLVWPAGTQLTNGQIVTVNYSATPDATALAGSNDFVDFGGDSTEDLTAASISGGAPTWGSHDVSDVDGDGDVTEFLSEGHTSITVGALANLTVQKEVQGIGGLYISPGSGSPAEFPASTTTIRYRIDLSNAGNVQSTGLVAYDILPFVGDTGSSNSLATTPRGSEFAVAVTSPITAPAGIAVEYSASSNPCRPEVNTTTSGCVNDWSTTVPAGGARSLRFTATAASVAPGTAFVVPFDADSSTAAPGQLACNSVAAATDQTLATEPAPVCIELDKVAPSVTTTASVLSGLPGDPVTDSVVLAASGDAPDGYTASVSWTLLGPVAPAAGSCAGLDWSSAATRSSGTVTVGLVDPVSTPSATLGRAGCYTYAESIADSATTTGTSTAPGDPAETTLIAAFDPALATQISATNVNVGASVHDTVIVTGTHAEAGTMTWALLGPLRPIGGSCLTLAWARAAVFANGSIPVAGDSSVDSRSVRISKAGCYSYTETLSGDSLVPTTSVAGQATETVLALAVDPPTSGSLAFTGFDAGLSGAVAVVLLALGAIVLKLRRRQVRGRHASIID